jgi:MFS family permease
MTSVREVLHALHAIDVQDRLHTLHPPSLRKTFRSLRTRNFQLYASGQALSLIGTWMQRLGQEWLVLDLTGSGSWLGVVAALQFLPLLVIGPWGGLVADRVDKRRLLLATQSAAGVLAAVLGLITLTGSVQLWMVLVLAVALGVVTALDNPTRQAFVVEMVGTDDVTNAVTLNSVMINAARAIGPAVAGVLIASTGMAPTFLLNAGSYGLVVVALIAMDPSRLQRGAPATRGPGQLREGLRYVARTPALRTPLLLMVVAGMFAYEFSVTLPLLARYAFEGDARTLGILNSALGAGAVVGGLITAGRNAPTDRSVSVAAVLFGGLLLVTAAAPTLWLAAATLLLTGALSITFIASANSLLQLRAPGPYRGRVMALWSIALLGTTTIGAPIVGWVGQVAGARASLAVGGAATVLAAAVMHVVCRRRLRARTRHPDPPIELSEPAISGSTRPLATVGQRDA